MEKGIAEKVDIAFFKFCYVDITRETNIERLFEHYVNVMSYLNDKYPGVKFLHVTVPIQETPTNIKTIIKKI